MFRITKIIVNDSSPSGEVRWGADFAPTSSRKGILKQVQDDRGVFLPIRGWIINDCFCVFCHFCLLFYCYISLLFTVTCLPFPSPLGGEDRNSVWALRKLEFLGEGFVVFRLKSTLLVSTVILNFTKRTAELGRCLWACIRQRSC